MSATDSFQDNSAQRITKSTGFNKSEQYLAKLCERSFLSLWSYPNLFRSPGKELADLMVVFGDHVLIFSDKECSYPSTNSIELNWSRWYKRAIAQSAHQLWRAERWIRTYPYRIFLDAKCEKQFPFEIDSSRAKIHLIIVARGVSEACRAFFNGGSGSLILNTSIKGVEAHTFPFWVGDTAPDKTYIHVLDDITLDIIMETLDTISDFTSYLTRKEILCRSNKVIFATGEEDLLPFYLGKIKDNQHDFVFPEDATGILVSEGEWLRFKKDPQRIAQLAENEISYLWDKIIERFNSHALNATQYKVSPGGFKDSEKIMRFFASESRFRRRFMAKALLGIMEKTPEGIIGRRVVLPEDGKGVYYILVAFPKKNQTDEENRLLRSEYLTMCCNVVRAKFPNALDIIGFATESGMENEIRSEDAIYFDGRDWDDEMQVEAEEISEKLDILRNPKPTWIHEKEFPDVSKAPIGKKDKIGRNDKCPCGSGFKYKKCHGK